MNATETWETNVSRDLRVCNSVNVYAQNEPNLTPLWMFAALDEKIIPFLSKLVEHKCDVNVPSSKNRTVQSRSVESAVS